MQWWVAGSPRGLSVSTAHNVLIACSCTEPNSLQEYSPGGLLVRHISINDGIPWQGIELSNGQIAVSICGVKHGVCVIGADGQVVKSYSKEPGSAIEQFSNPRGLAVDKKDCLLVANYDNNRIRVLNPSLTDADQFPIPDDLQLLKPISLCYNESRNRLSVAENSGPGMRGLLLLSSEKSVR